MDKPKYPTKNRMYNCYKCGWTSSPTESVRILIDNNVVYVPLCKSCRQGTKTLCYNCKQPIETKPFLTLIQLKVFPYDKESCNVVVQLCEHCRKEESLAAINISNKLRNCKELCENCKRKFICLTDSNIYERGKVVDRSAKYKRGTKFFWN